ncbi:Cilia- and flagella-associated protein 52 [Sparganum proliferum]
MSDKASAEDIGYEKLSLQGVIGFNGSVVNGLIVHPDRVNCIYALGCTVVIEDMNTRVQTFLHGHTSFVICLAVSDDGRYIASGQITHMGYKADVLVWSYAEKTEIAKNNVRIWVAEVARRKIIPTDCNLNKYKRTVTCIVPNKTDDKIFCGTLSGDVLVVNVESAILQLVAPEKDKFSLGISSIYLVDEASIIFGAGDGTVQLFNISYKSVKGNCAMSLHRSNHMQKVMGAVTSISLRGEGHQFFVATDRSHVYRFNFSDFSHELVKTCHSSAVNDVKFANNCADLFVTCSFEDIRVFNTPTQQELLRINIPNMVCYTIDIMKDGTSIVSGWDDSKIRAFAPESGRLMYTVHDAHKKGVTAIAATSDKTRIVSGGGEGQVRVWRLKESINPQFAKSLKNPYSRNRRNAAYEPNSVITTTLEANMKEHANAVSCVQINKDDTKCASSSADGTCIIWDLIEYKRLQIIFANTLFRVICFHPSEVQVLTAGTDRKIGYCELYDGSLIRELDASRSGSINGMDITSDGNVFVTGGDDEIVKVWRYSEGDVTHVGLGHSSPITRLRISPDQKLVITVSEDGGIFIWKMPPR